MKSKGYTYSPFFIILLMLTAVFMTTYFMKVDNAKAHAIKNEGELTKKQLKLEETKSAVQSAVLFSAYDAIDECIKPMSKTTEDLATCIEGKIEQDLNKGANGEAFGRFSGKDSFVEVIYLDKNGRVRTDGFIVQAKGNEVDYRGVATGQSISVEKYVDARVFPLIYYGNDLNSKYESRAFHHMYVNDFIAVNMERLLSGARCSNAYIYDRLKGHRSGIKCATEVQYYYYSSVLLRGYTSNVEEDGKKENKFCSSVDRCWEDKDVKPFMRTAGGTLERMKLALLDVQRKIANEEFSLLKTNKLTLVLDVKKITVDTTLTCDENYWCCDYSEKDSSKCERWDKDYVMKIDTKGVIEVEETLIDQAAIKESDATQGVYTVCYESPIIAKGEIKPLEIKRTYEIPYEISVHYRLDCPPNYLEVRRTYSNSQSRWVDTCEKIHTTASAENLMSFDFDEESLKFKAEMPQCEKGSIHPYTEGVILPDRNGDYLETDERSASGECGCGIVNPPLTKGYVYDPLNDVFNGWGDGVITA